MELEILRVNGKITGLYQGNVSQILNQQLNVRNELTKYCRLYKF